MNDKTYCLINLINLILLINQIFIAFSELNCEISVPDNINTQKLDHIICLGTSGFTFPNFGTFSDGSLIVETSRDLGTVDRSFYGITVDGKPYFSNNQYHMSLKSDSNCYRKESENTIITFNDDKHSEYLISVGNNINVEMYDLKEKTLKYKIDTSSFIEGKNMDSEVQSLIQYYDGSNYYLYHSYLTKDCYIYVRKLKFHSVDSMSYIITQSYNMKYIYGKIGSCYLTKQNNLVCLTIYSAFLLSSPYLYISVFDSSLTRKVHTQLSYTMVPTELSYPYFFKCIHLKEEIGVFVFYRSESNKMVSNPKILFKKYSNSGISDYIPEIELNKKSFNIDRLLNDIVKINEKKLCFISTSENKEEMYIILISIYDNTKTVIRYYILNIFSLYSFKFYLHMRANAYNNFIAFAFSFCRSSSCGSSSNTHYPGLIFFNYPNGTDFTLNLINNMFSDNDKINNYTINLHNQVRIDNNIFGLQYEHINIKKYINCNSIQFFSSVINHVNIIENYNLGEEENIIAKEIPLDKTECSIIYTYIITEPNFAQYNSYATEKVIPDTYTEEKFEEEKDLYESRYLFYNLSINEDLSDNCPDNNCLICKDNDKNKCIVCKYNYIINSDENGKYKTCFPEGIIVTIPDEVEETQPIKNTKDNSEELSESYKGVYIDSLTNSTNNNNDFIQTEYVLNKSYYDSDKCSYIQIINNQCKSGKLNGNEITDIYDIMKKMFLSDNYDGKSKVVSTENVIYQLSTFEYQKNNDDPNISSVDLGACESRLKGQYNISENDSLIMLKIDLSNDEHTQKYVYYEIYDPYEHTQLNMSYCEDLKITVNTPVNLDDNSIELYKSLKQNGYNIFDSSDDFYNDICSTYTTANGTDMLLEDRKRDIYSKSGNYTMCQKGCEFILYNTTTKKSKCDCDIQKEINSTDLIDMDFTPKQLASEFFKAIKNSNFRVLKCYKLAIDIKKLFKNNGRIIMSFLFLAYLISVFIYIIKERKKIDMFINLILKEKENFKKVNFESNIKGEKVKIKEKRNKKKVEEKKNNSKSSKKEKKSKSSKSNARNKDKKYPPRKKFVNQNKKKNVIVNSTTRNISMNTINPMNKKSDDKKININIYPISSFNLKNNTENKKFEKKCEKNEFHRDNKKNKNNKLEISENLNDEELNSLEYNIAVIIDKRTYFQYYWSLLKKKHLILFTILPANDYNLYSLKVALFLLSFSLYFTINGFFFDDSTMHKINQSNGKYKILNQISQILYSSIISAIINMLLKILSLSEKNILLLKHEKDIQKAKKNSIGIKRCIIIKFIIFFILSNFLLLFFWYFISCFCAVYTNTQSVLIKDTLISFSLSMVYPFGLNLFPGLFRIPSLRDKTQKSKCLYQISGFFAIL